MAIPIAAIQQAAAKIGAKVGEFIKTPQGQAVVSQGIGAAFDNVKIKLPKRKNKNKTAYSRPVMPMYNQRMNMTYIVAGLVGVVVIALALKK